MSLSGSKSPSIVLLFAAAASTLLLFTGAATQEAIKQQRQIASEAPLRAMLADLNPSSLSFDTEPVSQPKRSLLALGEIAPNTEAAQIYITQSSQDGDSRIAILPSVAVRGYGGPIQLLIAIDKANTVLSVVPTDHRETPGLGDAIDRKQSTWSDQFKDRSLENTPAQKWVLASEGGAFDQITGATVTSRAMVDAVRRTLEYAEIHTARLFDSRDTTKETPSDG
ncbi:MAG: RnfABCDGE type electron transport complex subunit G [Pseudomonadota bacterium]